MKLAGILEYWNIGLIIGIVLFFKFKFRGNPIKTNPFIHYSAKASLRAHHSIIPIRCVCSAVSIVRLRRICHKIRENNYQEPNLIA